MQQTKMSYEEMGQNLMKWQAAHRNTGESWAVECTDIFGVTYFTCYCTTREEARFWAMNLRANGMFEQGRRAVLSNVCAVRMDTKDICKKWQA